MQKDDDAGWEMLQTVGEWRLDMDRCRTIWGLILLIIIEFEHHSQMFCHLRLVDFDGSPDQSFGSTDRAIRVVWLTKKL